MNNQSQPEIKEGLQFQLDIASDRTIFTIHSIVDGEAFVIWPKSTRMQNYLVADVKSKFMFGTWVPVSPASQPAGEKEEYKEILTQILLQCEYGDKLIPLEKRIVSVINGHPNILIGHDSVGQRIGIQYKGESPSTPNQSDDLQEARKEIEELKEEIRKLRCWLKYNDWLKQNYKLDDWSTNPGPHYFQKRDGKVIPFNISKPEMDIRREYIKLNNL